MCSSASLLCVAASRAVTSAFAAMLRSRRARDLAAVLLAVAAALLGPLQIASLRAAEGADWRSLLGPAEIVGWTPFGAAVHTRFRRRRGPGRASRRSSC